MSLFFRGSRAAEERAISTLPWSHGGDLKASASLEGAMALVPVYAAVRLISDSVATLPMQAFRKTEDGRQRIPLPSLFESPAATASRVAWLQRCMVSLLLRGNAYGIYVGNGSGGLPQMIEWLHPDKVRRNGRGWTYNGRVITEQVLHIPALTLPGEDLGVSPLSACKATVTAGMETQRFMKDWYRNKAIPSMKLRNTERTIPAPVSAAIKERAMETIRAGEPFVTGKDWELDIITLSADDAGFVSASKLTATQVATIFGIPPEMIGGESGSSLTYSTVELNQIQFLTNTLRPWLVRLEAAFSSLLPGADYVRFNTDALIRVETKTRYEVHKIARDIGLNNLDELRTLEDMAPLPDGQGEDYTPLGKGDSPARLIQQMYLGIGRVITAKEARLILKAAGVEIDETVTLEQLHENLPPLPAPNEDAALQRSEEE